jgi:hypothetical protein
MSTCPSCAKLLPPSVHYCPYCGADVQAANAASSSIAGRSGASSTTAASGRGGPAPATRPSPTPSGSPLRGKVVRPWGGATTGRQAIGGSLSGRVDWIFLITWAGVTVLGWGLAWTVVAQIYLASPLARLSAIVGGILLAGLGTGAAQWLVLRARAVAMPAGGRNSWWWILALPLGWGTGAYLYQIWPSLSADLPPAIVQIGGGLARAALIGGLAGLAQWPVARQFLSREAARRWVAFSAAACAAMLLMTWLATAYQLSLGWFPALAFRMEGQPMPAPYDILLAGTGGLLLGGTQYVLLRGRIKGALWWPVASALGLAAGVTLCEMALTSLQQLGEAHTIPFMVAMGPAEEAFAWGLAGVGLGVGQWLALRHAATQAGWWVLLSSAGYVASWALGSLLLPGDWLLLGALTSGVVASLPAWFAARREFSQARWLPAWETGLWTAGALALAPLASQAMAVELVGPLVVTLLLALAAGGVLAYRG